jgi:hypothetical protein
MTGKEAFEAGRKDGELAAAAFKAGFCHEAEIAAFIKGYNIGYGDGLERLSDMIVELAAASPLYAERNSALMGKTAGGTGAISGPAA